MKVYIRSCHAALEYDHAQLLGRLGHEVLGEFDLGNPERPKVPGATDANRGTPEEADVILLHQTENFPEVFFEYACSGKPVVLSVFGQGCMEQHKRVAAVCRQFSCAHVMPYSIKESNLYADLGVLPEQLHFIRFSKDLTAYRANGGWNGRLPVCYVAGNAIQRRGDGCGWEIVKELIESGVPIMLSGNETDVWTDFGIGRLSYNGMISMFHQARCYLAMGTIPAPYTLSLMEAMCAGTPTIAYDNGAGIAGENFGISLGRNVEELRNLILDTITKPNVTIEQHEHSIQLSNKFFDVTRAVQQWNSMLIGVTA